MTTPRRHPFDIAAQVLAERLRGLEASAALRAVVADPGVDWDGVVGQASEQLVLAALAAALRDLGLAGRLEPELRDFLAAVHAANLERNQRLREQLARLVGVMNRIDVEPVLLKGAIRLVDGLYPDPGWRMMWDLDLLVPQEKLPIVVAALHAAGYAQRPNAYTVKPGAPEHHHHPALRHPEDAAVVEIHGEPFKTPRQQRLLRAEEVRHASQPIVFDGQSARVPSSEHQFAHLVGHCQILHGGHAFGRVGLRDRLEAALLTHRSLDGDRWPSVLERFTAAGYRRPLLTFLLALDESGFNAAPGEARRDALARLQGYRVARQARSAVGMWVSRRLVHGVALLNAAVIGRGSRRETLGLLLAKTGTRFRQILGRP